MFRVTALAAYFVAAVVASAVATSAALCAAEQTEPNKEAPSAPQPGTAHSYPVPKPQPPPVPVPLPIPSRHQAECDHPRHDLWAHRACGDRGDECLCPDRCADDHCRAGCEPLGPCADNCGVRSACAANADADCRAPRRADDNSKRAALPPGGVFKLEAFALYAERSMRLGECGRVVGGDVGVRSLGDLSHEAQLRIGRRTRLDREKIVVAPSVAIGGEVSFGLVAADKFRDNDVSLGPPRAFPAAAMPPLPLAFGGGSGPNVLIQENEALALSPGNYGTLSVDGVLVLNPGHYRVDKVRVGDHGRVLAILGGVRLDVGDTLTVGRRAAIESGFDLSARGFKIGVAGEDAMGVPAASFGEGTRVRALLVVPRGSLSFADRVEAKGAFAAFDIAAGEHVRVTFEDGLQGGEQGDHGSQQLSGYFVPAIRDAPLVGPVPRMQTISLAIGLPGQNPNGMRQAAHDVADPMNPQFRKYLTVPQFAATYGATATDYQAVQDWATAHGLIVVTTYPNRLLVAVSGSAAQIEAALFVNLDLRKRPDGTAFYATDREPSIDLPVQILRISGLDNRVIAEHGQLGAGPGGTFNSADLRAAYASCMGLTGAGQSVGLFELDDFTPADIPAYECRFTGAICNAAGQPTSPVPTIATTRRNNAPTTPQTVGGSAEVALDIEMAIGVAPGLASVQVFEAPNSGNVAFHNDLLTAMATTTPLINQISSSWFFVTDANTQNALYELAIQGQSFLQASGDQGSASWATDPGDIRSLDAVTVVGGTALTMNEPVGGPPSYNAETAWNIAAQGAGGGGVAANTSIPTYQKGIDMTKNGGSTTNRNLPDVAAVASNLGTVITNPTTTPPAQANGNNVGTSAAAPIWAGLIALANQMSATSPTGAGRVGNANALLYAIGKNATAYPLSFNDIASGNTNGSCPGQTGTSSSVCKQTVQIITPTGPVTTTRQAWAPGAGNFSAVAGYDLATGLGTPKCALLNELATGATTAVGSTPVTITYHQTGACNGYATGSGA